MSGLAEPPTLDEVRATFLKSLNNFGKQLERLTTDLEAIEVVTAIGETTVEISSNKSTIEGSDTPLKADITNIANGQIKSISGKLNILARTRFELDGDLLVILPTKQIATNPTTTTNPDTQPEGSTESSTEIKDRVEIDKEVLDLHKENVKMAIDNLQFVYEKVLDIAKSLVEGDTKSNFFGNLLKLK
jgi:hypothetical protein